MSFTTDIQRYAEQARDSLLRRLPEDRHTRLLLAGGSATVATVVLWPLLHHFTLGRRVSHTYPNASVRQASLDCGEISSIPKDLAKNSRDYRVVHDKITKHVSNLTIMLDLEHSFTKLLRYNMTRFARSPQGWSLWFALTTPEDRGTFSKEYIEKLQFVEGDVVCGAYKVVKRTPLRVEIALQPPTSYGKISGLLITSLRPRNEGATLSTESIQWTRKDSGSTLPLESPLFNFLHSLTARWLIVSGTQYLKSITESHG